MTLHSSASVVTLCYVMLNSETVNAGMGLYRPIGYTGQSWTAARAFKRRNALNFP